MPPKAATGWRCKTCHEDKNNEDPGVECELCEEWVGLECTNYSNDVFKYLKEHEVVVTLICDNCKETLPELKNLLEITKQQKKIKADIEEHDTRITKCELGVEQVDALVETVKKLEIRLGDAEAKLIDKAAVQTIAQKCFNSADYPPIKMVQEVRKKQEDAEKKLDNAIKLQTEETHRNQNMKSLIVYGVPETKEDKEEQMKSAFHTLQHLYNGKVEIKPTDLIYIARIGHSKPGQIKPIKLTFADTQKQMEVLTNNRNLMVYGHGLKKCELEFCEEADEHQHVYITTDKTKQQRIEEGKLREELKRRKANEPDLIIRNGKIIKKSTNHARWLTISQNVS